MEVKLVRADIVILASAHNPSIIAPDWLKANSLIAEEPKDFMHTPAFSAFESESFVLIVDPQRLQVIAKKYDAETLKSLYGIAKNYIKLLPHIPYKALGINFVWTVHPDEGSCPSSIRVTLNRGNLESIFEGHDLNYGGIVYAKKAPYTLKLIVEPKPEHGFIYNFNYHHELTDLSTNGIVALIEDFTIRYEHSSIIIKGIYTTGG